MHWPQRFARLGYAIARMVLPGGAWRFLGVGYCPSCDNRTLFALHKNHAKWIRESAALWENSLAFKTALEERESNICGICRANFRVRAQARSVLDLLGFPRSCDLLQHMRSNKGFAIYETASSNLFRIPELLALPNYITSEYFENAPPGAMVNGVLNQNLERLTFDDDAFDLVLTSDVLEHVADLDRALSEIRRVLKPGGYHVFTVPADRAIEHTVERARLVDGQLTHLKPPVFHGDTIRNDGILAFRDFGRDTPARVSSPGISCRESPCSGNQRYITSVYIATKNAA
jgi:hypothetical protein